MFKRLLNKHKKTTPTAISTLEKLNETLEMLEKKELVIQKKISAETQKAKDFTKLKNKKAAIRCLKKKKLYEAQVEQIENFQLRIHDQMITIEGAKATTETVDALRMGVSAVKSIQQILDVDAIDKTMEEVTEHKEHMKQIQEALESPIGGATDFDEDELEAELEELEADELEEQLLQPPREVPATIANRPARDKMEPTTDVDELATLQAEMAL